VKPPIVSSAAAITTSEPVMISPPVSVKPDQIGVR
jgi:hypothetical protein